MLLVDADQAEARHRREDGRARSHDHRRLSRDDPLALVPPLRLGQARVEHGDPVAEAGLEAAQRLRRERDLGDENDRPPASLERRRARLEIDLGLAAAGCPGEQEMSAAGIERLDDPRDRPLLRLGQLRRLRLACEPGPGHAPLSSAGTQLRRHELERARRRRAVVVGDPEREIDERRRQLVEHRLDRRRLDPRRRIDSGLDDDAARGTASEADRDDRALLDAFRHLVGERPRDGARGDEWIDGRQHRASVEVGHDDQGSVRSPLHFLSGFSIFTRKVCHA